MIKSSNYTLLQTPNGGHAMLPKLNRATLFTCLIFTLYCASTTSQAASSANESLLESCSTPTSTPEAISKLIRSGADVHCTDESGRTPLILAAQSHINGGVIRILIDFGGKIEHKCNAGHTPIMHASQNPNVQIIQALIANKADLTTRGDYNETPLMNAARNNRNPAVISAFC